MLTNMPENIDKKKQFGIVPFLQTYGIIFIFLVLCIILAILKPTFIKTENIMNVLRQISINGILAVGMTLVILTGGIDLSVGSLVGLTGIITAGHLVAGTNPFVAVLFGIGFSIVLGFINGILISKWNLAPFIVTLAMMTIGRGITYTYSNGKPISALPESFLIVGKGYLHIGSFEVPLPFIILVFVFCVIQFILAFTSFGRYIYAIGGNERAAEVSGVNVKLVKTLVYMISGLLAGIASIVLTARVASGLPQAGESYELDAIAAVVIGGTSLSGGKGRLWGTLIGALILGVLSNGMDLLGIGSFYQQIIKGLIILVAVLLDSSKNKK